MNSLTRPSYAKVNLFLDILRLRGDGYHDLRMVNAKISLHDSITCSLDTSKSIHLTSNRNDIPLDEKNTAYQAARRFLEVSNRATGCKIHLQKAIPHGAGLGGGSSNAAVVLESLNTLTGRPLTPQQLHEISAAIGADVPFFLYDRACRIESIGEAIAPLEYEPAPSSSPYMVLVSPAVPVPTGTAYRLWDESAIRHHQNPDELIRCITQNRMEDLHLFLFNSFEPVIYAAYPQIEQAYRDFCEICPTRPLLSGSGSNVFALLSSEGEARRISALLCKRGYQAQVCRLCL